MKMKTLVAAIVTLFCTSAHAEISQEVFDSTLNNIGSMYKDTIENEGGVMELRRQFTYPEYVGSARRHEGKWIVEMWGGFPHDAVISEESFAMVVCHEFGHHLGGAPFNVGSFEPWASAEGQSDTFAASKCLPEYLQRFGKQEPEANPLPETIELCKATSDINCTRILRAAFEFAIVIGEQQKNPVPSFSTPDTSSVARTQIEHPKAQCRLDTMVAAYFNQPRPSCWFVKTRDPFDPN